MGKKPLTREEIEEKEALHEALTKWLNGQSMEKLGEYHKRTFGHDFDPNKVDDKANDAPSFDEDER